MLAKPKFLHFLTNQYTLASTTLKRVPWIFEIIICILTKQQKPRGVETNFFFFHHPCASF